VTKDSSGNIRACGSSNGVDDLNVEQNRCMGSQLSVHLPV